MKKVKISSLEELEPHHFPQASASAPATEAHQGELYVSYWYPYVSEEVVHVLRTEPHLGYEDKRVDGMVPDHLKDIQSKVESHYKPLEIHGELVQPKVIHVVSFRDNGRNFVKVTVAWEGDNGPYHGETTLIELSGDLHDTHHGFISSIEKKNLFSLKDRHKL